MHYVYFYAEDPKLKDNDIKKDDLLLGMETDDEMIGTEPKFRKPRYIFRKKKIIALAIVLAVFITAGVGMLVGYLVYEPEKVYDDSTAFYVTSNLLSEEGGKYTVYDRIEFDIYNYADSLRVSAEPVEISDIRVEADGKDITGKVDITLSESLIAPEVRSASNVVITLPEKYHGTELGVTVLSAPIEKVLKGTFVVVPEWGYELKDKEGDVCAELVIYANKDVTLQVEWSAEKLIPDSTNPYIRTAKLNEMKCTVELSSGMGISIPMFKIDPSQVYDLESMAVIVKRQEKSASADEADGADEQAAPEAVDTAETSETLETQTEEAE